MPDFLLMTILYLLSVFNLIFSICVFGDIKNSWKNLLPIWIISVLLNVCGWYWLSSGDCKYDGYTYYKIERKDNTKYFMKDGSFWTLDKTVDDKEFKIKFHRWSNQWKNGIYCMTYKNSYRIEFVPINENEVETKNSLDNN